MTTFDLNTQAGGIERQFLTHVEADDGELATAEVKAWLEAYTPAGRFSAFGCVRRLFPYPQEEDDEFLNEEVK